MNRLRSLFTTSGIGLIRLILLVGLILWGFLTGPFPKYSQLNVEGNLLGLVVAGLIALLFRTATLWLAGGHVVPAHPRNKQEQKSARKMLMRGGDVGMAVVREAVVRPGPNNEDRTSTAGPGVIDLDSTTAVVLLSEGGQTRIKEPGLIFLRAGERLGWLVDLRIQLRTGEFEYLTRDGIPVKVRVTVRFRIDQTHFSHVQVDAPAHPLPAPVITSQHAIRRAIQNQAVQTTGETSRWYDLPLGLAAARLRARIADFKFDELLQPQEPTANPRAVMRRELEDEVRAILAQRGISLMSLGLGVFFPIDDDPNATDLRKKNRITYQRVETWKAEWESRMLKLMAQAQAEADRKHDLARTQAQMELIMRVTQALEQAGPAVDRDEDQIARRFLATLQKMAAEPLTGDRLSEDSKRLLRDLFNPSDTTTSHEPPTEP